MPSRNKAGAEIDAANDSRAQIVTLVGSGRTVLVVSADSAGLAPALVDADCLVTCLDDADRLDAATRSRIKDLVLADLGSTRLSAHFDPGSFDAVVLDTVLHQQVDPAGLVADAQTLLAPGGSLVVSVPNAAHGAARLDLLRGAGSPPVAHPLTGTALCELVERAGLVVEVYRATMVDPLDPMVAPDVESLRALPPGVVEWVRHQPDALCFHYVVKAKLPEAGTGPAERPRLDPLAAPHQVRRTDEFTEQRVLQQADDHARLIQRDHVLGLEARTATAAAKQRQAEDRVLRLQARAKRLRLQLLDLTTAVDKMPRGRGQRPVRDLANQVRPGRGGDD